MTRDEPGRLLPRYPIYIPSKSRYEKQTALTAQCLKKDGVPFRLVVEPQEQYHYAAVFGEEYVLVLPFRDRGSVIPTRNWIIEHAIAEGHERHWQLDDNILVFRRWYKSKRIPARAGLALRTTEDFTDRYENVAISGLNYQMFATGKQPPFHLNCRVYSCCLVNNAIPHRWRGQYNEDTDMCLQVLADGWCTVLVNAFVCDKIWTAKVAGGNKTNVYSDWAEGRLKMARSLERQWPGVVTTQRRFRRPQHVVKDSWQRFDTSLKLKEGVDLEELAKRDKSESEYGMELRAVREVKSERLRKLMDEYQGSDKSEDSQRAQEQ